MPEVSVEIVDAEPGVSYSFRGISEGIDKEGRVRWVFPPGLYRCMGIAMSYRTQQEFVVYTSLGGHDAEKCFIACLSDWAKSFKRIKA